MKKQLKLSTFLAKFPVSDPTKKVRVIEDPGCRQRSISQITKYVRYHCPLSQCGVPNFFSKKHDMILQESNTYSLIYREPKEFDEKKLLS